MAGCERGLGVNVVYLIFIECFLRYKILFSVRGWGSR